MASQYEPKPEHPSTYVVEDRSNEEEMTRLDLQDHLLTAGMGGVLPEQPEPASFESILDVGCATGGWLLEAARAYPDISLLVGVDVSKRMINYARTQAEAQQVSKRVEFYAMDALRMLEFPDNTFDLVSHRLAQSWVRTWDWTKLLQEYRRVAQPGGVIRCVEGITTVADKSPALMTLTSLLQAALHLSGHLSSPESAGQLRDLPRLLSLHGLEDVQTRVYTLEYRAGTDEGERFGEDLKLGFRTLLPFLRKWTQIPENYEDIYQQMLKDIQQPDFCVTTDFVVAWGINPDKINVSLGWR